MYYAQNMSFGRDMISETESRSRSVENGNDIKLFGRTIPLLETQIKAPTYKSSQVPPKSEVLDSCRELTKEQVEGPCAENSGQPGKDSASRDCKDQEKKQMQVNETRINPKTKEDQAEDDSLDQEKVFKKPDKVLPCPRCNSLDTKFCYFNNYNVNQPRHFCKNCQRYWTAGGTVRNVPVGAGRRKHKNLASQYRQIMVSSDGLLSTSSETTVSINHQLLSCSESSTSLTSPAGAGTVLKFGPETPLCESMETGLNLRDPRTCVEMGSVDCRGSAEDPSSCVSSMKVCSNQGSELPTTIIQREGIRLQGSCNEPNVPHPLNYPLAPWVYPWNPGWRNAAPAASAQSSDSICVPNTTAPNQVQLYPTVPMLSVPGSCPPSISLQAVPAWYWGCMPVWPAGIGNVSLSGSNACLSLSSSAGNSCCSGNGSATLGKHSRDANIIDDEKSESCVLVPKTLRVDDPDEASKSPIWATLGIKPAQKESTSKSNVFTISEPKTEGKSHKLNSSPIMQANPAALVESHTLQEGT